MKSNLNLIVIVVIAVVAYFYGRGEIKVDGGVVFPTPVIYADKPVVAPVQPTVDTLATTWAVYVAQTAQAQPIVPNVEVTSTPQPSLNEVLGNELGTNPFVSP